MDKMKFIRALENNLLSEIQSIPKSDLHNHAGRGGNIDDLLIFNATASQEYLNLYNAGLMTADELNTIRETGLSSI